MLGFASLLSKKGKERTSPRLWKTHDNDRRREQELRSGNFFRFLPAGPVMRSFKMTSVLPHPIPSSRPCCSRSSREATIGNRLVVIIVAVVAVSVIVGAVVCNGVSRLEVTVVVLRCPIHVDDVFRPIGRTMDRRTSELPTTSVCLVLTIPSVDFVPTQLWTVVVVIRPQQQAVLVKEVGIGNVLGQYDPPSKKDGKNDSLKCPKG